MSLFAERDEVGYDEAEGLIADLEKLVTCGLVTAVRQVGGPTRYAITPRDNDDGGGELAAGSVTVFSAG